MVTGSRAEYGVLHYIIKEIISRKDLLLELYVTGMHLSPEFGLTVNQIEADGFPITERIETLLSSDSEVAVSSSIALGLMRFAVALERNRPDILVLQGDRYETLAAGLAAMVCKIPVAHISGGKTTQGAIDEAIRHILTKISHLHFTHNSLHRNRIIQMGEEPRRVFVFGSPFIDGIKRLKRLSKMQLETTIGISLDDPFFIIVYHPVTLERDTAETQTDELLQALDLFPKFRPLFIMPNADPGRGVIADRIAKFINRHPSGRMFPDLDRSVYLNLLRFASCIIGNSSSGITEAPLLGLPAVNIGDRQLRILKGANVIDCSPIRQDIVAAVNQALNPGFRKRLKTRRLSPFGKNIASNRIVDVLAEVELGESLLKKQFHDLSCSIPTRRTERK